MDIVKAFWIIVFIALGIYVVSLILKGQWPDYRKTDWEKKIEEDIKKEKEAKKSTYNGIDFDEDGIPL
jgi:hypothetical protein